MAYRHYERKYIRTQAQMISEPISHQIKKGFFQNEFSHTPGSKYKYRHKHKYKYKYKYRHKHK